MKLLIESWNNYLNEEEASKLDNLNDILFGDDKHPGGRDYNAAAEAISDDSDDLKEAEESDTDYEKILQDFLDADERMQDLMNNFGDTTIQSYISEIKQAKDVLRSYVRRGRSRYIPTVEEMDNAIRIIEDIVLPSTQVIIAKYETIMEMENFTESYMQVRNAISLFTGESVEVVRDPEKFDPSKSTGEGRMIKMFAAFEKFIRKYLSSTSPQATLDLSLAVMLDVIANEQRQVGIMYLLSKAAVEGDEDLFRDLKAKQATMNAHIKTLNNYADDFRSIREAAFKTKTAKENYQFASGFLKYVAQRKPPVFIQAGTEIYRGITLDTKDAEILRSALARVEQDKGISFAGKDIASWTTDLETAKSFATGKKGKTEIVLKAKATRGMYVAKLSRFPDEEELICGGPINILGINRSEDGATILDAVFV